MLRGRAAAAVICASLLLPAAAVAQPPPERTYTSEHFSVTWVDDPSHPDAPDPSDADGSGVPDSVEALAAAFEAARALEVEQWGFPPPPVEGRYPLYIARATGRGYVQTSPGGEGESRPSFIVVPPLRVAPTTRGDLGIFAAHEFFHAIQYGLDASEPDWVDEATATWAQHAFDPEHPEAAQTLRDFVPAPRLPLYENDGRREYGAFLFFQFLSERHGDDIVRALWEEMAAPEAIPGAPDRDAIGALEAVLARRGTTLADEWGVFHLWRRRLGHFARAEQYRGALRGSGYKRVFRRDVVRSESCRLTANTEHGAGIPPLSGDYVRLAPHRRAPRAATATLTVTGPPGARAFYVVARRGAPAEEAVLTFDEAGVAGARLPFGRGEVRKLLVGLANGSATGDDASLAYSLRFDGRARTSLSPPGGPSTTTYGTGVVLRGTVTCRNRPAVAAQVAITEHIVSTGETRTYTRTTGTDGAWLLGVSPAAGALYSVALVDPLLSGALQEGEHLVGVRVAVTIELDDHRPPLGAPVRVSGEVAPLHPGVPVVVEYRRPGGATWTAGAETTVGPDGTYETTLTLPRAGDWEVRVRAPATGDDDHLPGGSGIRLVRVR